MHREFEPRVGWRTRGPAGHRRGILFASCLLLLAGCGGARVGPGSPTSTSDQTLNELFNLSAVYQRLGRLAAGPPLPFVGTVAYFGGRQDSTIAQLALSLENRALAFTRTKSSGYSARYQVEMTLTRAGGGAPPLAYSREEAVSVASFSEAQRNDETIVFQQGFLLAPGTYDLTLRVRDLTSGSGSEVTRSLQVPSFAAGSHTGPTLVYEAGRRAARGEALPILLNPRGTVAQGGEVLQAYVEAYNLPSPVNLPIVVRDDRDSVIYRADLAFEGGREVESRTLRLAPDLPPLGELSIAVGTDTSAKKASALVSFSRSWVVTNYESLLSLLRYFGWNARLDELRKAQPSERPRLWRAFWVESDPNPATPENEALDLYFTRVAIANERFRDEGAGGGWRTDRGEVYITLGEPDQILESAPSNDIRIVQWFYSRYPSTLTFQGQFGFTRLRLTTPSRAEFARVRALAQRQGG